MHLTFHPAAAEDIAPLVALNRDLIETYEDLTAIDLPRVLAWTERKITKNLSQYSCIFSEGQKVGYFRLCPGEAETELDDFYIFPDFRSRGIGTEVLLRCIREQTKPLTLCVFTKNTGAMALYSRMGFRVTENISHTRCIMRREVL